jgi:hypothetical protein
LEKLTSDIELTEAQITGIDKDNEVKSEQVLMSIFERQYIQPKQLEKLEEAIELEPTQDIQVLLNGSKDRLVKDAQIAESDKKVLLLQEQIESENKNNELHGVIDKQKLDIEAGTALTGAQEAEVLSKTIRDNANSLVQREVMAAQTELYNRQKDGFDDNKNLKLFEAQLDAYGMVYSSVGGFESLPNVLNNDNIANLYEAISGLVPVITSPTDTTVT